MFSVTASFCFWLAIALVAALTAWRRESRQASITAEQVDSARLTLGVGMAVTYLAATWFMLDVGGAPLKVASATASLLLVAYCVHSGRQVVSSWGLLDALIGGLMAWHVIVDSYYQQFSIGLVARAYGEWVLPYAAGRFAVMHRQSIAKLSPWFVFAGAIIGLAAIFETMTRINLWETLFHTVDDSVRRSHSVRYGWLYRAIGPTRHPIFLAVILMTLIPWVFGLWESARGSRWRLVGAWGGAGSIMLGLVASGSRAPFLALGAACCFAFAIRNTFARWAFAALIVIVGFVTVTKFEQVADLLDSNLREVNRGNIVVVDGKAEVYTGSRNRMYVVRIYGPLVLKGGPLGYGTRSTSSFPPDIKGLPTETSSRERLGVVDNSYILLGLRFGWVGVCLFVALIVAAISVAISLRRSAEMYLFPNGNIFVMSVACTLFALALEIATVFLHYDMGFWILFLIGTVAGMKAFGVRTMRGMELVD